MSYVKLINKYIEFGQSDFRVLCKDGSIIHDVFVENEFSNLGYRLAYFLHVMRGSNSLKHLSFYSSHVEKYTDDSKTLRGALGPRLKFWVGADQLQEAINKNLDVDDPEDMVKPKGIDQIERMYEDLKDGMDSTCCSFFDPSIDFEESNDIPNVVGAVLKRANEFLNLYALFNNVQFNKDFITEYFFFSLFLNCFSKILGLRPGKIFFMLSWTTEQERIKTYSSDREACGEPEDKDVETLISNLFHLFDFEKHMRCAIDEISVKHEKVNLIPHVNHLIEKFVNPLTCQFWKDYAIVLLCFSLYKYGKERYDEYVSELEKSILGSFKLEWEFCKKRMD